MPYLRPATFPLHAILPGPSCACYRGAECSSIGKCPDGVWKGLRVEEQRPIPQGCGYGIATGGRSGCVVVDLDVKPEKGVDGIAAFLSLAAGRTIPKTYTVRTGNGKGVHLYFADTKAFVVRNSQGKLGPGIDVRGEGGYVVGPGSPHASGGTYTLIEDAPLAEMPEWLLEAIRNLAAKAPVAMVPPVAAHAVVAAPVSTRLAAAAMLRASWPSSGRHVAQLALAGALLRGGWSDADATAFLVDVCGDPGKRAQTVADTRAAHDAGTPYTGFHALEAYVPKAVVSAARNLLGITDGIDLPADFLARFSGTRVVANAPTTSRKQRRAGHTYQHVPGVNAAQDKCRKDPKMTDLIRYLIAGPWDGVLQYDDFAKRLRAVDPPLRMDAENSGLSDSDVTHVKTWFEATVAVKVSSEQVSEAIWAAAKLNRYHPVREYLLALPRATTSYLDDLAEKVFGASDPSANLFLRLFLVAAVRRILVPGTKVDTMLVLYSPREGKHKSQFVEALFSRAWYRDQMPSLDGRDASHALEGFWGIEIPEFEKHLRKENATMKEFLSRCEDKYRAFGTGEKVEYPRQCVFLATTNHPEFLYEFTGNRRVWPIEVGGKIDLDFVRAHRDELWAEALALALDPAFKHWLDEAQEEAAHEGRAAFEATHLWEDAVRAYCTDKTEVDPGQIYLEKIAVGEDRALSGMTDDKASKVIRGILGKIGWISRSKWDAKIQKTRRRWFAP